MSCVRYCLREGLSFAVTDSRLDPPLKKELYKLVPQVEAVFGGFAPELINKADRLLISPGISLKEPCIAAAISRGIAYVGDIELFVKKITAPIIAITGSNAKSTVTALVGEMARNSGVKVKVAGNIGSPVLDLLVEFEADLYVLELSSFQLEATHSLKAKAAVVLNISEDHMDRYASMDEYVAAKMRIYDGCEVAVINRDQDLGARSCKSVLSFGLDKPVGDNKYGLIIKGKKTFLAKGDKHLLDVAAVKLRGRHNVANVLAALALGDAVGLSMAAMLKTLKTFSGLPHRCQLVGSYDGVEWYNDSKGTNVGASVAAIEGLGDGCAGKIILIAGGIGKGADFTLLQPTVKKHVKKVILIGEAAKELAKVLQKVSEIEFAYTLEQAVLLASKAATAKDVVLLSPACASFDMFDNFEHRGDEFVRLVMSI
jgi:UDP-N-acetylmuramoylalanine--D-glutamate ligase